MERFCDKCGSLVNGEGSFCTSCGARMSSVFDVGVSAGVDLSKRDTMPSTADRMPYSSVPMPTQTGSSYQGQSNYNNNQPYGQPVYPQGSYMQSQEMTLGQWISTLFLSVLGFIGIIILFIWAFSDSTHPDKKNFARAMLIAQAILLGVVLLFVGFAISGNLFTILSEDEWEGDFAALLMRIF